MIFYTDAKMGKRQFQTLQEAQAFHDSSRDGLQICIRHHDQSLPLHIKSYQRGQTCGLHICVPAMTIADRQFMSKAFTKGMLQRDMNDVVNTE